LGSKTWRICRKIWNRRWQHELRPSRHWEV
jgi:hypothetical protein